MNKAVYAHLLATFGRRPCIWLGLFSEITRAIIARVLIVMFMAQAAASLAVGDFAAAEQYLVYFLVASIVGAIIGTMGELLALRSENDQYRVQTLAYHKKFTGKDMAFYRDHQTGYLASMFRQYVDALMQLSRLLRGEAASAVVSLVAPAFVLFIVDWRLGLVAVGLIIVQFVYIAWASARGNEYRIQSHEVYRKLTAEVSDEITNIVAFKSAGREKSAYAKVAALAQEEVRAFWLRRKSMALLDLPRDLITTAGVAIAFWVVIMGAQHGGQSVGVMVLTITYMFQIIRNVRQVPTIMAHHDDHITKAYPALAYLSDDHETIKDPQRPKKLRVTEGAITMQGIDFAYPTHTGGPRHVAVFKDFTLHINGGERVGIVGLSGAGKSTLASLLLRFDDIQNGAILIDGTDIRQVRQSELRQKIAYVPQEPLLFHCSIRENLLYFNAHTTDSNMIRAAKAAHAHEFITRLPRGYDTVVGERGVKLSGGQKQRIVIARAIIKNAPIMVFDEATSALDTESEKIIQQALPRIIGKHTAIVIAHRLSTVADLDRIVVLHGGKIVESGTHKELCARKGRYYSLWQKQGAAATEQY